jgi:AcrR family transcriptional regulator
MARKYELKRRAERQEATRRRIVEATVALHTSLGPARTTISAIAERAGVERLTVYKHFPDERSLFAACSAHYRTANPLPDPTPWSRIADPEARLRTALAQVYAYYRRTEQHWVNILRDAQVLPVMQELLVHQVAYWAHLGDVLVQGWEPRDGDGALRRAAIGHALDFQTWYSLVRQQGLDDEGAIALVLAMVRCGAGGTG